MQTEILGVDHDADYQTFRASVAQSVLTTNVDDALCVAQVDYNMLWKAYLDGIPAEHRQHYNCSACRHFFKHYGSLVLVDADGRKKSAVWGSGVKGMFGPIAAQLAEVVRNAPVKAVFATKESVCGHPQNFGRDGQTWTHYSCVLPASRVVTDPLVMPGRVRAESMEAYTSVSRVYQAIELKTIQTAYDLADQGRLNRSGVNKASLEWLLALHAGAGATLETRIWYGVAKNPALLHLRGSALGQLLEDLQNSRVTVDRAVNVYNDRTGTGYRVATAPPKIGSVRNAERIVTGLGVDASLKRRFAKVEELQKLWEPKPKAPTAGTGGVFGGVVVRAQAGVSSGPVSATPVRMTWQKFAQTLLPSAGKIQFRVRQDRVSCHWGAFTAPLAANDPPIFAWDDPHNRNPYGFFAWACRDDGPKIVGFRDGQVVDVTGVAYTPSIWNGKTWGHDHGVVFTLDGARFQADWGMALFPVELRTELQPARATITAFSKANNLADRADATAVGFYLQNRTTTPKGAPFVQEAHLNVYTNVGNQYVVIDRWD